MDQMDPQMKSVAMIAGIFGLVAAILAWIFAYGFFGGLLIGILMAIIVAIVMWYVQRDDDAGSNAGFSSSQPAVPPASQRGADASGAASSAPGASVAGAAGQQGGAMAGQQGAAGAAARVAAGDAAEPAEDTRVSDSGDTDERSAADAIVGEVPPEPAGQPDLPKDAASAGTAQPVAAPLATPAETATKNVGDGPGIAAPAAPADKPEMLSAPRGGGADDLKRIKGVGPKLETMLHGMGVYHFDQIAGWTDREIAWVDQNLEGFKGRVSRDDWVPQARTLADGGETEFSSRKR